MTGYATGQCSLATPDASGTTSAATLGMEIRSVNSRFLDLTLKLPEEWRAAEPGLRELIKATLKRGKVEVRAWTEGRHDSGIRSPSLADLQKLVAVQDHVRSWMPHATPLSVAEVLALSGRPAASASVLSPALLGLASDTLREFVASRAREGARLVAMLRDRTGQIRALAAQAEPLIPALVAAHRQRFLDRWQDAMGTVGLDAATAAAQDRALAEATAYAIRIDVAEELTRLTSHLDEIERLLTQGGELGKRLDFLIQELHREANTLGSKSSSLELTRVSVDMKVLIEQMREQVQNLE